MAYADRTDIERQYGASNVIKWADLNNDGDEADIDDRVEWALENAQADLEDLLREGPYTLPFDCPPPTIITRLTASKAGVLLYESRGVTDYDANGSAQDQLQWQRKYYDRTIKDILVRRRKLDATQAAVTYPQVVTEEDEEDVE